MRRPSETELAVLLEHASEMARELAFEQRGWAGRVLEGGPAELTAYVDVLLAAEAAWSGLELAIDRDVVPTGLDPLALPAVERLLARQPAVDTDRLLALVKSTNGPRRALLAGYLAVHAPLAAVSALADVLQEHAEDPSLEVLLGLPLPTERRAVLACIEGARARRAAQVESGARLATAATAWRDAWGLPAAPFRITIQCADVPPSHRKASHLREQTSRLVIVIGHVPVQGPALDEAWSIRLRSATGEAKHGFSPSRWEGELRATMLDFGEVTGIFRERTDSPIKKGKAVEIRGTIDDIPRLVGEIEKLTQRSFNRAEANVIAVLGDAADSALADRVRDWLGR